MGVWAPFPLSMDQSMEGCTQQLAQTISALSARISQEILGILESWNPTVLRERRTRCGHTFGEIGWFNTGDPTTRGRWHDTEAFRGSFERMKHMETAPGMQDTPGGARYDPLKAGSVACRPSACPTTGRRRGGVFDDTTDKGVDSPNLAHVDTRRTDISADRAW